MSLHSSQKKENMYQQELQVTVALEGSPGTLLHQHIRLESHASVSSSRSSIPSRVFLPDAAHFLETYGARRILWQLASSPSREYPQHGLDTILPLHRPDPEDGSADAAASLQFGPSGVTLWVEWDSSPAKYKNRLEKLLRELIGRRLLLTTFNGKLDFLTSHQDNRSCVTWPKQESAVSWEAMEHSQVPFLRSSRQLSDALLGLDARSASRRSLWREWQRNDTHTWEAIGLQYTTTTTTIEKAAKLLETTKWFRNAPNNSTKFRIVVPADEQTQDGDDATVCPNRNAFETRSVSTFQDALSNAVLESPPIVWSVDKIIQRPRGVANGGVYHLRVENRHAETPTRVVLMDAIPTHLVLPRWQGLNLTLQDQHTTQVLDPSSTLQVRTESLVQVELELPPQSRFQLSLPYEPVLLPFESFPGDANRGWDVPAAKCQFQYVGSSSIITLYSNSPLLLPPVPDMSMPFNVIALTCSLYVMIVGSMVALMVKKTSQQLHRKLDEKDGKDDNSSKGRRLLQWLRRKLGKES